VNVEILPVWKKITPALGEELMAFWRSNKAIVDDAAAAMRATRAVFDGAPCNHRHTRMHPFQRHVPPIHPATKPPSAH
jgi:hypothetical protein